MDSGDVQTDSAFFFGFPPAGDLPGFDGSLTADIANLSHFKRLLFVSNRPHKGLFGFLGIFVQAGLQKQICSFGGPAKNAHYTQRISGITSFFGLYPPKTSYLNLVLTED
jgi:hypothetical protein